MSILWTIIIGFVAGVVAKFLMPGKNEPSGFILTTILGIVGAVRIIIWHSQYGAGCSGVPVRRRIPIAHPSARCAARVSNGLSSGGSNSHQQFD